MRRSVAFPSSPYYEYHGADPNAYYGIPYRSDGGVILPRKNKRSFTEKLSQKLDKFGRTRERDRSINRAYQEVYRDHYGNVFMPRVGGVTSTPEPWLQHYSSSPGPRRTFHNVIQRGRSAPSPAPNRSYGGSGWENAWGHQPRASNAPVYGDVLYDDYQNFAINSNVCMCEDFLGGTQRGKKSSKKCKKCGYDRMGFGTQGALRRSASEESVNARQNTDPYEYMRRRRMINPKPVYYDEQDEYEEVMYGEQEKMQPARLAGGGVARSRSPQVRRSSSPGGLYNTPTLKLSNSNRSGQLNTKDCKEMQNIAIRSSPIRTPNSTFKRTVSTNKKSSNVVTVNGCATKNSSIIYLSPDTSPPPTPLEKDYPGAHAVKIVTSTPSKPNGGESHISPYDLIKKYVVDSPANSLSDSNLSSDDPPGEKSYQKSMESDFSDSEDDDNGNNVNVNVVKGIRIGGVNSSFRIAGQKIQIYSDGSVATDNKYSMSESDEESTDDNNYDADCSVVESPRVPDNHPVFPSKPSRKEKNTLALPHSLEQLNIEDLDEIEAYRTSPTIDEIKPVYNKLKIDSFSPSQTATLDRKSILSRKKSSDSQKSLSSTARSKSFNGSRESLSLFHAAELKNQGISKNFSSDIIRELYGSKTSLLKHLDQQREDRQHQKQLEQSRDIANKSNSRTKQETVASQSERKETGEHVGAKHAQVSQMKNLAIFNDKVQRAMFNDTTRLRPTSRPSLKDALQSFSAAGSTKLGRLGISQSFRERITTPLRPKDPPPPPPLETVISPVPQTTKKLFSFNKNEIKRINKLLGISGTDVQDESKSEKNMYDIAEHEEAFDEPGVTIVENSTFYDGDIKLMTSRIDKKKDQGLRLRPKSNEFFSEPVKPPRAKRERSKSFTPRSNPKTSIFNRSFSHIPKSSSSSSLSIKSKSDKKLEQRLLENNQAKRTLSSSDLVHIFPDEERRSFKDIRKILSSPSISSSSSANQIYRPKSQLSNGSSVMNNSIKEEQGEAGLVSREPYFEHIYEEIKDKDIAHHETSQSSKRPLPPLPTKSASSPSRASPILSSQESPVKSIFEGATKYDILHYLEDARERGLTDCDLDLDDDEEEEAAVEVTETGQTTLILTSRNHANRISNISNNSNSSSDSYPPVMANKDKLTSVEIERNDSGLGSETSRGRGCGAKVVVRKRTGEGEEVPCLDCDQLVEQEQNENSSSDLCSKCERHRQERKEIITEIIETEIKYGRDLRIIVEEFYRPMMVAGLLTQEQLANIFLNAEELKQFNDKFTDSLKESIGIALDQGDEDLCTVSIGKLFLEASPMLGAFKSYCTRQGSASNLLASLEREKELLRIFLKVSQMENTILRRMNLSSFLMVPVQRVTRYPLLLSRLLKVTPSHQADREAIQEAQETIESGLDSMNQETSRDTGTTKLWRRISMINPQYRRSENQLDVLGSTTWGVRKMALESLGWSRESRDDVTFHRESRVMFTQPTDVNWRSLWTSKLQPINALLVTLGQNTLAQEQGAEDGLQFPRDTGCREAALILMKEKGFRYQSVREPLMLDRCVVCWEQDWDDCFEVTEFTTKESFIFKAETEEQTLSWFRSLQFYCLSLGQWRRRRNALANIMINGMARSEEINREFNLIS